MTASSDTLRADQVLAGSLRAAGVADPAGSWRA